MIEYAIIASDFLIRKSNIKPLVQPTVFELQDRYLKILRYQNNPSIIVNMWKDSESRIAPEWSLAKWLKSHSSWIEIKVDCDRLCA